MNNQNFSNYNCDVFISYRHANKDLVAPVEEELKRRGISYFIDREGINYGMAYSEVISLAINACKVLLFFWTPESNNSKDMLREAQMALDYDKTIVPYKIGNFDVKEHRSLHYIMAPYSRYDVSRQTHETVVEIVDRVQSYLPNVQPVSKDHSSIDHTPHSIPDNKPDEAEAQFNLAKRYFNGDGVPEDKSEAVFWYRKAAEQGFAKAQYNLGCCYYNGDGVPVNKSEAVNWYRKAAEQGLAEAQNMLGDCLYNGLGVPQKIFEAAKWYRKAAEQGLADAQLSLALCYSSGEGVSLSKTDAAKWFRKAAEQGLALAQLNLGYLYLTGDGVRENKSEGIIWFHKAAEQGDADAQYFLGFCYLNGEGVSTSYSEAMKWFRKAAEQGHEKALEYVRRNG